MRMAKVPFIHLIRLDPMLGKSIAHAAQVVPFCSHLWIARSAFFLLYDY